MEEETTTTETEKSVWNKTGEEVTVGDAVKIQLMWTAVSAAVIIGGSAAVAGAFAAYDALAARRAARRREKAAEARKNNT